MKKLKYHIITFGCQMNKSDSEKIALRLENCGYSPASEENAADLIVVNMCSVRQSAVDRILGLADKLKKLKSARGVKTILTGCVLKKDEEKFKKFFDFILSIKDLSKFSELPKVGNYASCGPIGNKRQSPSSVLVPISHGCNNFCSYCVVPHARGKLICRPSGDILKEAKASVFNGAKEIWLLGQNVNDYRCIDRNVNFAKLLRMVNDVPGEFWVRFTSPNPSDFTDELVETMAKCGKITPYINLPVQSGDDEVLKKMNRQYTGRQYRALVKKIQNAFKKNRKGLESEISLSTDVIVGYPGETKKQFENSAKIFKEIKYDMAYISKYSPRPQTAALKLKDNVSPKEKDRRWKILTGILKKTALKKNKKYVGKKVEILVEKSKNGFLLGKSRHYKTVKLEGSGDFVGKVVEVKIVNASSWGLKGKIEGR